MKIDLKNYTREFYEEFYYVNANRKKIQQSPRRKILKFTTSLLLTGIVFTILVLISWFVSYRGDTYLLILNIFLSVFAIGIFCLTYYIADRIKKLSAQRVHGHLEITSDGVKYTAAHAEPQELSWERIKFVMINLNSIIFLPTDKITPFIGVPADDKDKIIEEITKLEYFEKLRDNTV